MGEDIAKVHFAEQDFVEFRQRMEVELEQLRQWDRDGRFHRGAFTAGLELEAWLLDAEGRPAPDNGQFLESLSREWVVPELAKFNFELNVQPQPVAGLGLERVQQELLQTWQVCGELAERLGLRITCIGILPTITQELLCAENMTPRSRFEALNREVFRLRRGRPDVLSIDGIDSLRIEHHDVMLEAASTSLQVHLKVPLADASRYLNAFIVASPATVAVAANAPLLFGKRLWHDTRIAVFEQAVDTGDQQRRVSFGRAYAPADFLSLFEDKVRQHPALLPVSLAEYPETVPHLRMHNGTLWDWNRPLIGFESDGSPHVRVEHRVMSAGPTAVDMFANVAFAIGLAHHLASHRVPPEQQVAFESARRNFYAAAREGLMAEVDWLGQRYRLQDLLLDQWLPAASDALDNLGVDHKLINGAEAILRERTQSGRTGAVWQLEAYERHAGDPVAILNDYLNCQASKKPVHEW
ncbi:MAG: hypothetical protein ACTHK7_20660 [Aureliella sp.]